MKSFCGKRDAFDCAGIWARVFRLPEECSNWATIHRRPKTSFPQEDLFISPNGCNNFKIIGRLCIVAHLEHSTGDRKTRARIPTQSKASLFPHKDFKLFKFEFKLHWLRYKSLELSTTTLIGNISYLIRD